MYMYVCMCSTLKWLCNVETHLCVEVTTDMIPYSIILL